MIEATLENFNKTENGEIAFVSPWPNVNVGIVYVSAPWCGPCKMLSPIVEQLASEMNDSVIVRKIDADNQIFGDLLKELSVRNIPTILLYNNGKLVEKTVGMKSKTELLKMLEPYISSTQTTE